MKRFSAWFVVAAGLTALGCGGGSETQGNANGGGATTTGGTSGNAAGGNGSHVGGSGGASSAGQSGAGASAGGSSGGGSDGPTLGGCPVFPVEDAWNTDISAEPADPMWTERLLTMVGEINLHPDYGRDGEYLYGIPVNVVPEDQAMVDVAFQWWPEESDPGPYPFPDPGSVKIEGNDAMTCEGDCHVLVVQQGACMLYEGFACSYDGGWQCGNGAVWNLRQASYGQRPKGWTSADAAGLAITPGLLRYDEVLAGEVRHALRFTARCTRANFVAPATHQAVPSSCDADDPNAPPMGLRVRLKTDFDLSSFSSGARAVLTALKTYGMILADNGSNFYFQGEAHPDWDLEQIEELKTVPVSAFEVVAPPPLEP